MQQNAILTFFKIAAFTVLAVLVGMSFWQQEKSFEKADKMAAIQSQMADDLGRAAAKERNRDKAIAKLSGRVEALTTTVQNLIQHGMVARPTNGSGTRGGTAPPTNGGGNVGVDTSAIPEYLSDAAKKLWGSHTSYLDEEVNSIPYPEWDTPGLDPNGIMRRWYGDTPSDINPITSSDARVTNHIHQYCDFELADRHALDPSKYGPGHAIRCEVNKPDYTEWIFWLRNDVKWHVPQVDLDKYPHLKGEHKVTAHDYKFAIDMIKHPDVNSAHLRNYYSECSGVEVIDDNCLIVRWNKPQYNAIGFTLSLAPLPRFILQHDEEGTRYTKDQQGHAINEHWFYRENNYCGSGPFYLAELEPGSHLILKRNEQFVGEKPRIKEVHEEIFSDPNLNLKKLENGEFDAGSIRTKDYDLKMNEEKDNDFKSGKLEVNWVWAPSYTFIAWAQEHPIFKDVDVRHAMTMACDRFRIRDVLQMGRAKVVTGPQHPNSPFYPPDVEPLPFDLEKASARLEKAGWKDTDGDGIRDKELDGTRTAFRFKATVPSGSPTFKAVFEIFKEDLRKIGVEMDLDFMQWKQFVETALDGRNFECTALVWSGDGWQSDLYQIWHSKMADEVPSSNFIAFRDKQVDEWIEEARTLFEHEDRVRIQRKLHTRLHELQPYTFITAYQSAIISRKSRTGGARAASMYKTRPVWRLYPMFMLK